MIVGKAEHKFHVYQDLVCDKSTFFKAAVSRDWQEARSKMVRLRERRPAAFKIYLEAIYNPNVDLVELARPYVNEIV